MNDGGEFRTAALSAARIAQFSAAMHDPNPVHLDPSFCASIGLPGIIAPGGISVVALAHAVALRFGAAAIREIDLTFRSPVPEGESIRCELDVEETDGPTITVLARAVGEDGRLRADGTVLVERMSETRR